MSFRHPGSTSLWSNSTCWPSGLEPRVGRGGRYMVLGWGRCPGGRWNTAAETHSHTGHPRPRFWTGTLNGPSHVLYSGVKGGGGAPPICQPVIHSGTEGADLQAPDSKTDFCLNPNHFHHFLTPLNEPIRISAYVQTPLRSPSYSK